MAPSSVEIGPLVMRTRLNGMSFDGRAVTVASRPSVFARTSIRQYALSDFHYVRLVHVGNDSGMRTHVSLVRGGRNITEPMRPKPRVQTAWASALVATVNQARVERILVVLGRTVGLGPWPVATWDMIRIVVMAQGYRDPWPAGSGTPEEPAPPVAEWKPGYLVRSQIEHALDGLRQRRPRGHPADTRTFPKLNGVMMDTHYSLGRGDMFQNFAPLWNGLITGLEGGRRAVDDPGWDETAIALLRWGHDHAARVIAQAGYVIQVQ